MELSFRNNQIFFRKDGLWYKVEAILNSISESNEYMERNPETSCLHYENEVVIISKSNEEGSKMDKQINVEFIGIDSFNRPIFKGDDGRFYGSTNKLFGYADTEEKILKYISEEDLTFFGYAFDCEPMGSPVENIKISRG